MWAVRFGVGLASVVLLHLLLGQVLPAACDLFVLLVALNGLAGNTLRGLVGGLVVGLLQDLFTASPYGLHALACCVVGYGTALLAQRIVVSQRVVSGLLIALGVLVHQVVVAALLALLGIEERSQVSAISLRVLATTAIGVLYLWLGERARTWSAERRRLAEGRVRLR